MRARITQDVIGDLTPQNLDIRDTKIAGFLVRCRASGKHSYLVQLGRGHYETIGRVGGMELPDARAAAEKLRGDLSNQALFARGDDAGLTMAEARAAARVKVQERRRRRSSALVERPRTDYRPSRRPLQRRIVAKVPAEIAM